ncbi:uncharacterized protein LOC104423334 isoform X2 [Eucalyptus grandis]|uniref:uncharacterized protein LOC104423334 isoform X2 n=1 Tax=Eucalyptus grandis TaxID=71139 RepID=UPI00192EBBF7|nr:uncharacterized protein LOC104423334 isoform X2 [Eucalyptus grandis]
MEVQMPSRMRRGNAVGGRRKPLPDRTNAPGRSSSRPPPPPPPPPSLLTVPRSRLVCSDFPCCPRIGCGGSGGGSAQDRSSRSAALALAFSRPRSGSSSSVIGYGDIEVGKPCTVYRQRRTEAKRKCGVKEALQLPPSSSSVERTENIGKKLDKIRDGDGISKSGVTPSKRCFGIPA